MIQGKTVLGIIPARGGSKGLPGKNLRLLGGKPLIVWSIEAGTKSRYIDELVISTDSEEIAAVAKRTGATVPFIRPNELATDDASSVDVVLHALDWYAASGRAFDLVALIEPTSPLRTSKDIDDALEVLLQSSGDSIVSICRTENTHPSFMVERDDEGCLRYVVDQRSHHIRRQDLSPVFFFEGTIYISEAKALRATKSFYQENTVGFEVPKWKSLEVDDMDDLIMVEAIMKHKGICP